MIYAKLINKTKTLLGVICECSSRYLKLEVNTGKLIKKFTGSKKRRWLITEKYQH